ncbi:peptidoglycan-binding protein [Streptomyces sp. NPDC085524]|uniref:peptidoglycan-binding domain-containing protein n=1 Tax=unclassified Streptomyces TaxID=2593676 RepID=UPI0035DF80E4
MSHDTDENGAAPGARPFVHPYVTPSPVWPSGPTPPWPQPAPVQDVDPHPAQEPEPAPDHGTASVRATAAAPVAGHRRERRERRGADPLMVAVLTLLGLGAAGGMVLMLTGPDEPKAPRAKAPTGLTVPGLPGRAPESGGEPTGPTGSPEPSGRPTPSPSASQSSAPPTTQAPKPTPSASASAGRAGVPAGPLRMGDKGPEVRALQELLFGQGFTYVSVTGVYDGQTKRGVSQLQRDRDIKGDPQGIYGPATQAALE